MQLRRLRPVSFPITPFYAPGSASKCSRGCTATGSSPSCPPTSDDRPGAIPSTDRPRYCARSRPSCTPGNRRGAPDLDGAVRQSRRAAAGAASCWAIFSSPTTGAACRGGGMRISPAPSRGRSTAQVTANNGAVPAVGHLRPARRASGFTPPAIPPRATCRGGTSRRVSRSNNADRLRSSLRGAAGSRGADSPRAARRQAGPSRVLSRGAVHYKREVSQCLIRQPVAGGAGRNRPGARRRLRPRQSGGGLRRDDLGLARLGGDDDRGRAGDRAEESVPHNGALVRPQALVRP